jgi:hypothetical protein
MPRRQPRPWEGGEWGEKAAAAAAAAEALLGCFLLLLLLLLAVEVPLEPCFFPLPPSSSDSLEVAGAVAAEAAAAAQAAPEPPSRSTLACSDRVAVAGERFHRVRVLPFLGWAMGSPPLAQHTAAMDFAGRPLLSQAAWVENTRWA